MSEYLVLVCNRCRKPTIAFAHVNSKTCPFCGKKIRISSSNVVAKTRSPLEARNIVARHKIALRKKPGKA